MIDINKMNLNRKKQLEFIFDSTGEKINSMKVKSSLKKEDWIFFYLKLIGCQ